MPSIYWTVAKHKDSHWEVFWVSWVTPHQLTEPTHSFITSLSNTFAFKLPGGSITFSLPSNNREVKTTLEIRLLMLSDGAHRYRLGFVVFPLGLGLLEVCSKALRSGGNEDSELELAARGQKKHALNLKANFSKLK